METEKDVAKRGDKERRRKRRGGVDEEVGGRSEQLVAVTKEVEDEAELGRRFGLKMNRDRKS